MRKYRGFDFEVDAGMQVVAYDMNSFTQDKNLSDLGENIIYEQVGPNYTNARFNQRYYDIAEIDNNLFFATLPEDIDTLSQSSFIKYNTLTNLKVFHAKDTPAFGDSYNTTADFARGWFIPFNSNQNVGVIEDSVVKVLDADDGSFYQYGTYDYYGSGDTRGQYVDKKAPVSNDTNFFYAANKKLYNIGFFPAAGQVDKGSRIYSTDSEYKVQDILVDINANYTGSKTYYHIENMSTLILDNSDIYLFASLKYDDDEGYPQYDLYLVNYDTSSVFKSADLINSNESAGAYFDVLEPYKYGNKIYFRFRHNSKHELCSYNLVSNDFDFKYEISNHPAFDSIPFNSYIITGDKIIISSKIKRTDYDSEPYGFDLVFKVLNMDGVVQKTLHHKNLDNLHDTSNDVRVIASVSDADAVYFFATRYHSAYQHSLVVKIDTHANSVQKSRNRFNNHLTGVISE